MEAPPTLDTGFFKSRWISFWLGPFLLFFVIVSLVVGRGLIVNGTSEVSHSQFIGLALSTGFVFLLGWLFFRGFAREQVWILEDEIVLRRVGIFGRKQISVSRSEIVSVLVLVKESVFDLRVLKADQGSVAIVQSGSTRQMNDWIEAFRGIAPMIPEALNSGKD